jgi:uncharacterized repeat protein (TIGR01451 family)
MRSTARLKLFLAAVIAGFAMNIGNLHAQETVFYSNIYPSVITLSPVYAVGGTREWADDVPFSGSHVVSSFRIGYKSLYETDPPFKATFRFYGVDPVTGLPGALLAEITRELPAGEHPLVTIQLDPSEQFVFNSEPGLYYSGASGGWFSVQYEAIGTSKFPTFLKARHARGTSSVIMYNITDERIATIFDPDGFIPASLYLELLEGGGGGTIQTDLSLTIQDSPIPANVNEPITYRLTITNTGADATGVRLTDTLPSSVTFESVTSTQGSCTPTISGVDCALGNLADGASANVDIVVIPNVASTISNTASVSANEDDPTLSNNSATQLTLVQDSGGGTLPPPSPSAEEADLDVDLKDSPDPVRRRQQLTYTATVTNDGPDTATSVELADALPSIVDFVSASASQGSCSGSRNISCQLGDLAAGDSVVVKIVVIPTRKKRRLRNSVMVQSQTLDPDNENNSDKTRTRVR